MQYLYVINNNNVYFKLITGLFLMVFFTTNGNGQFYSMDSLFYAEGTTIKRQESKKKLEHEYIAKLYGKNMDSITSNQWQRALWAIGFLNDKRPNTIILMQNALKRYWLFSPYLQKLLLENVFALKGNMFSSQVNELCGNFKNLKQALIAEAYLGRCKKKNKRLDEVILNLASTDTALYNAYIFSKVCTNLNIKDFNRIIDYNTVMNCPLIISLQPNDRTTEGVAIIKNVDGSLVKGANNKVFSSPQLARSVNNMPWYISNGNTPQGLFAIKGIGVSDNAFIGKTPNLQLVMPGEVPAFEFFEGYDSTVTDYILPYFYENFDFYGPNSALWQSFYAGKAGRTEIIAHGTTVNPDYYKGEPYFPNTPTMGCLSSIELYDPKTGKCIKSNQLALVNAFLSTGFTTGYLLVVEAPHAFIKKYK
jgi:hypothetical protein